MVNIYKQKLTELQDDILRVLFINVGKALNQRQLAKILDVSPPGIKKALPGLKEEYLAKIEQDKDTKRWSIELNRDNHKAMELKRVDNLKLIYETGLGSFLEDEFAGGTIILFGSYSRGEDTINSDIDIAVIGRKEKDITLEKYEKMLERKIILNFYASFKDIHKNLKENIFNGIVLYGAVEL
jgi:predicted nucleotidyltransferase